MKRIILHIINTLKTKYINHPTPLGRWNIETCSKKINKKVDFANEDHCGPCGNIFLHNKYKFELSNNNQNKMPNDN